ncbi:hypothetical protein C8R46DRAFT_1252572 [Mycena filopes]|nr:hypothetical protein C8R46DRAFT_1252572 [Mycena filopes]
MSMQAPTFASVTPIGTVLNVASQDFFPGQAGGSNVSSARTTRLPRKGMVALPRGRTSGAAAVLTAASPDLMKLPVAFEVSRPRDQVGTRETDAHNSIPPAPARGAALWRVDRPAPRAVAPSLRRRIQFTGEGISARRVRYTASILVPVEYQKLWPRFTSQCRQQFLLAKQQQLMICSVRGSMTQSVENFPYEAPLSDLEPSHSMDPQYEGAHFCDVASARASRTGDADCQCALSATGAKKLDYSRQVVEPATATPARILPDFMPCVVLPANRTTLYEGYQVKPAKG